MTDTYKLNELIRKSGLKKKYIAKKLGLTPYGLAKKMDNHSEFKSTEISVLCEILNIKSLKEKEDIFFAKWVD